MRNTLVLSALIGLATACSSGLSPRVGSHDVGSFNAATVEVTAVGGFAGVVDHEVIGHDDHSYLHTVRHVCTGTCGPAIDSAAGTLSPAATDSLFNIVWEQNPFALKDDYGLTPRSADMFVWTMRVTMGGATKTVRADDGTMPPQMAAIVSAMRGTISAARR